MRQLRFAALAVAAIVVATPAFAADSPVAGTWATEAKSDFGTFKSTWTVAESGGTYPGDVKDAPQEGGPGGGDGAPPKSTISNVAVDGSTLTFDRELVMGDMTIKLSYKVTADGNNLTGQTHSDFGDIPITGTRQ
jgi:opacity protein-like surface antigen